MPENKDDNNLISWLGFPKNPDYKKWRMLGIILGCVLAIVFFTALFISTIQFFAAAFGASDSPTIHADARNYALILAALLSIPFVIWRVLIAQKQANIAEQGLITDRITKAVEQLGAEKTVKYHRKNKEGEKQFVKKKNGILDFKRPIIIEETAPNLEVRLGAIYSLERIAQDSMRDHISVMEILCAYVRNNAPASEAHKIEVDYENDNWLDALRVELTKIPPPPIDIQAILSVIGRRKGKHIKFEQDAKANLIGRAYELDLRKTNLQNLDLTEAKLGNALLDEATLVGAYLLGAKLQGAHLMGVELQGANLHHAKLQGAHLLGAELQGANLTAAHTRLAAVKFAALKQTIGLTEKQINSMLGDNTTTLPEKMAKPGWASETLSSDDFLNKWFALKKEAGLP